MTIPTISWVIALILGIYLFIGTLLGLFITGYMMGEESRKPKKVRDLKTKWSAALMFMYVMYYWLLAFAYAFYKLIHYKVKNKRSKINGGETT